jgi:hypothetical protein
MSTASQTSIPNITNPFLHPSSALRAQKQQNRSAQLPSRLKMSDSNSSTNIDQKLSEADLDEKEEGQEIYDNDDQSQHYHDAKNDTDNVSNRSVIHEAGTAKEVVESKPMEPNMEFSEENVKEIDPAEDKNNSAPVPPPSIAADSDASQAQAFPPGDYAPSNSTPSEQQPSVTSSGSLPSQNPPKTSTPIQAPHIPTPSPANATASASRSSTTETITASETQTSLGQGRQQQQQQTQFSKWVWVDKVKGKLFPTRYVRVSTCQMIISCYLNKHVQGNTWLKMNSS